MRAAVVQLKSSAKAQCPVLVGVMGGAWATSPEAPWPVAGAKRCTPAFSPRALGRQEGEEPTPRSGCQAEI